MPVKMPIEFALARALMSFCTHSLVIQQRAASMQERKVVESDVHAGSNGALPAYCAAVGIDPTPILVWGETPLDLLVSRLIQLWISWLQHHASEEELGHFWRPQVR